MPTTHIQKAARRKKRVYVETSIISYLSGLPSRNLLVAAWQSLSKEWWEKRRRLFEIYASPLVLEEAGRGDPEAAKRRVALLTDIPLLNVNERAIMLAQLLITKNALPRKASDDAMHISLAAVHNIDY